MPASLTLLTEQTIRNLAGEAVFQRGYRYFEEARVTLAEQKQNAIRFLVNGSDDYLVRIKHTSRQFEATCDCPASQNFDFCKHCVAASLFYLSQLKQKEVLKKSTGSDLLHAYLTSLPRESLVAALSDQIQRNPITLQNWMLKAETAAEKLDAKALKKHITAAIPYNRHLYRHQQVQAYFGKVEALLERLESLVNELDPDEMIKLVDYAISRIRRALETVDDSGGYRSSSLDTLGKLHSDALEQSARGAKHKADYLVQKYLDDDAEFYPGIPEGYEESLGPEVLDLFYQRLEQRWMALPDLDPEGDDDRHLNRKLDYLHTQAPLLKKARSSGDKKTEIGYLRKSATNPRDMVALAKLYTSIDDTKNARQWLKKATALSNQSGLRAERGAIIHQEIEILLAENKTAAAMTLQWQEFASRPHHKTYISVAQLAEIIGDESDWYHKAVSTILARAGEQNEDEIIEPFEQLAKIHLYEGNPVAALNVAEDHTLPVSLLQEIALQNSANLQQIQPIAERIANHYLGLKNIQSYESAVGFLSAIDSVIKRKDKKAYTAFLSRLASTHKAKRNFIALLEPLLPDRRD